VNIAALAVVDAQELEKPKAVKAAAAVK